MELPVHQNDTPIVAIVERPVSVVNRALRRIYRTPTIKAERPHFGLGALTVTQKTRVVKGGRRRDPYPLRSGRVRC
jgi:hypothetical protein